MWMPLWGPPFRPIRSHPAVRRAGGALAVALSMLFVLGPLAALAQSVPQPSLSGSIEGTAVAGGHLTFRITASEAGGWQQLRRLQVILLLHSVILDKVEYDQVAGTVTTAWGLPVAAGSAEEVAGPFFRVSARNVTTISGGDMLTITIQAQMVQAAPPGSQFNLGVIDANSQVVRLTRAVQIPAAKTGFSWGAVLAAVIAALFAGSFLGGLFVNRRRPPPRPSVYGSVRRGLEQKAPA
jgi:hypothetical protein